MESVQPESLAKCLAQIQWATVRWLSAEQLLRLVSARLRALWQRALGSLVLLDCRS